MEKARESSSNHHGTPFDAERILEINKYIKRKAEIDTIERISMVDLIE